MSVINTNYLALVSQNNLNKSQSALGTAIERLSSGMRINSAKDDAAGQAIANRFTANVKGLTQAARNANDGISIAQTTEGALNEINNNLQRIRELTVQAQNGSNSASDIDSIQQEVNQRLQEINRVAEQTNFNGIKVLASKTDGTELKVQVGAQDNETINITIGGNESWNLWEATGTTPTAQVNNEDRTVSANGFDVRSVQLDTDRTEVTTDAAALTAGQNAAEAASGFTTAIPSAGTIDADITSVTTDGVTQYYATVVHTETAAPNTETSKVYAVTFDADGAVVLGEEVTGAEATAALGGTTVAAGDVYEGTAGSGALSALDAALKAVDNERSNLGAVQNRFQSTIANLNNTITNLSAARSRIEDADYAVEVSNMTRAQILQQAGTSVLAQANQVPQTVLSLLR
ncbi:FliC/FljB family flagellin [Pusillimonas noertemannii]|uniref:FliC/FljB family flagellin n=1 Tax=Pusillimonas noertemannii TaxID=305977 RepID=UPI0002E10181|nr:FliC/FljB family flagellin [Pusillimonas noertemannii]